jgi:homocitrate synthase NifV
MAVSNSIASIKAGAALVDCTAGGIGERAGNCSLLEFVKSAQDILGGCRDMDIEAVDEAQKEMTRLIA